MLSRSYQQLHDIYRKILEFILHLSSQIDAVWYFPQSMGKSIQRIYNYFDFDALYHFLNEQCQVLCDVWRKYNHDRQLLHKSQHPLVVSLQQYAQIHFKEAISLQNCAVAIHVSAAHLARVYRKECGITVVQHLQALRVQYAQQLLQQTDEGILKISLDCGFQSLKHFHRVFLKHCQYTPAQYRKSHQSIA
ncbi:MAG: helix-turn-helix transcriptional regulator [Planctomycetes bacterium]|nr:helix-turn-helix transcriptional regulator [Planctomycetota bacterium]